MLSTYTSNKRLESIITPGSFAVALDETVQGYGVIRQLTFSYMWSQAQNLCRDLERGSYLTSILFFPLYNWPLNQAQLRHVAVCHQCSSKKLILCVLCYVAQRKHVQRKKELGLNPNPVEHHTQCDSMLKNHYLSLQTNRNQLNRTCSRALLSQLCV